jgi:hypothetical protein
VVNRGKTEPGPALYPECAQPGLAGVYLHRRRGTPTCAHCRNENRLAVQRGRVNRYVNGPRRIPALGTQRRIRALCRVGWPQTEVAGRIGVRFSVINRLLSQPTVYTETAGKIAQVYADLAWETGPSNRTRIMAAKRGWPGPMDWDDPDNPDEVPACEIEAAHREALVMDANRRRRARLAELSPEQREERLRMRREQRRNREARAGWGR